MPIVENENYQLRLKKYALSLAIQCARILITGLLFLYPFPDLVQLVARYLMGYRPSSSLVIPFSDDSCSIIFLAI